MLPMKFSEAHVGQKVEALFWLTREWSAARILYKGHPIGGGNLITVAFDVDGEDYVTFTRPRGVDFKWIRKPESEQHEKK